MRDYRRSRIQEKEIDELVAMVKTDGDELVTIDAELAKKSIEQRKESKKLYKNWIIDKINCLGFKNDIVREISEENMREEIKKIYWHIIENEYKEHRGIKSDWYDDEEKAAKREYCGFLNHV